MLLHLPAEIYLHFMLKKLIGILLLFVLSIQILPVGQVGALLCNNQMNEELQHSTDAGHGHDFAKKFAGKNDFLQPDIVLYQLLANKNREYFFHLTDKVPANHSLDIHVPPPNC